jgi:hypothetical protein
MKHSIQQRIAFPIRWVLGASVALLSSFSIADASSTQKEKAISLRIEGKAFEYGENGTKKDPEKALKLYCEAARLGDMEAQYNLGWMLANGRGVARDDASAAYFFSMAAKQGDALSIRMLRQVGDPVGKAPSCLVDAEAEGHDIVDNALPQHQKVLGLVQQLAPQYGVSPRLAMAIMRTESNFNPTAVSPKNAQGLMQLIPETAERFNVKKPFDPEQNIRGGLAYLRWLLAYFQGNIALVAAGYNAGEGAVNRYAGIPPYAETQGYVKRIREIFRRDDHPFDATVTPPSPELPRIIASKRSM